MAQKESHKVTPKPGEVKSKANRPKTEREKEQEREQAIISSDRGKPGKPDKKKGPLSVGVDFDHS